MRNPNRPFREQGSIQEIPQIEKEMCLHAAPNVSDVVSGYTLFNAPRQCLTDTSVRSIRIAAPFEVRARSSPHVFTNDLPQFAEETLKLQDSFIEL